MWLQIWQPGRPDSTDFSQQFFTIFHFSTPGYGFGNPVHLILIFHNNCFTFHFPTRGYRFGNLADLIPLMAEIPPLQTRRLPVHIQAAGILHGELQDLFVVPAKYLGHHSCYLANVGWRGSALRVE